MLQLLSPGLLLGLLGILLPLAIHLWNRQRGKTYYVGSIQLLRTTPPPRLSRIRFTELGLFILRSFLFVLFTLLLTQPVWKKNRSSASVSEKWVLVDPRINDTTVIHAKLTQLRDKGYEIHTLASEFPAYQASYQQYQDTSIDVWSLLQELALQPVAIDSVVVFSPTLLKDFNGKRPVFPFHTVWHTIPLPNTYETVIEVCFISGKHYRVLVYQSEETGTLHTWEKLPLTYSGEPLSTFPFNLSIDTISQRVTFDQGAIEDTLAISLPDTLSCLVYYTEEFSTDLPYLTAALDALNAFIPNHISYEVRDSVSDSHMSYDWVIQLSDTLDSTPLSIRKGLIKYRPAIPGENIVTYSHTNGSRIYYLNGRLNPGNSQEEQHLQLPAYLLRYIWESAYRSEVRKIDQRQLTQAQALPVYSAQPTNKPIFQNQETSLRLPLWILLMLGLLIERIWSLGRQSDST